MHDPMIWWKALQDGFSPTFEDGTDQAYEVTRHMTLHLGEKLYEIDKGSFVRGAHPNILTVIRATTLRTDAHISLDAVTQVTLID
jgi:hypothetical protein